MKGFLIFMNILVVFVVISVATNIVVGFAATLLLALIVVVIYSVVMLIKAFWGQNDTVSRDTKKE